MPYINTVDINGTTYYFENLTDGNYVVDLPELKENGTFLLQGDVEDKLNSYQSNKPLSANQGRVLKSKDDELDNKISNLTTNTSNKDTELDNKIAKLSEDTSKKDTELDEKISTLRTDMGNNDASTLTSAKAYADEQSSAAISSANEYANTGLDKKLDKSGGTITGALEVVGDLTADQKLQTKYGMTIYKRGDVSKEITAVCTGENAGKFIGKSETDLARISVATPVNNDDAATKKYVDDRVGSVGGAGIDYFDVYAEVKYSYVEIMDGFYVSNCLVTATFDEIKEALDAGKTPRIIETNSLDSHSLVGGIMSLYSYDSNSFVFTGVSRSADSASGLAVIAIQADGTVMYRVAAGELPAVKDTDNGKYMLVDGGAWKAKVPPTATQSTPGFMSAKDKIKLDGLYSVEDYPVNITVPPSPVPTSVNVGIAQFTVSCDKTFDEIKAAIDAGKNVFGKYANNIWPLSYATDTMVSFAGVINFKYFEDASNATCTFTIQPDGTSILTCAAGELPAPALDGSDNGKVPTVNGTRWEMKKAVVDDALSDTSTNPVQNKVVKAALDSKASTEVASQTANGLMSAEDKKKLDGVAEGANKTTVIDDLDPLSHNPVSSAALFEALSHKANNTEATEQTAGLMSAKDKKKLNGIEDGANKTIVDEMLSDGSTNPVQNKAITAALASVVRETIYPIDVTATSTEWVVDNGIAYKEASADRTFDDIKAASIGNKTLVCEFEGMTYSLILDSSTAFIFASYRGAVGNDSQYADLGKYPTSLISITTTGVVISRTSGDLPAVNRADNDKMLIVVNGEWAMQRVPGTTVDAELSTTSENPVQNKTVTAALNGKLPKTGGTVTGALRTNDSFSAGGTIAFGEAPIVLSQTADGAAEIHSGTSDVDDNPPPLSRLKVASPTEDDDAATKKYVDDRAVRYDAKQTLTSDQKLVACANIGAVNEKRAWVEGEVVLLPRGADGAYTINITPSEKSNDYTLTLDAGPENVPVYVAGLETPTDADTNAAATVEYVKNKVSDATILTSPNGTKYKITVSDDGKLSAVAVN